MNTTPLSRPTIGVRGFLARPRVRFDRLAQHFEGPWVAYGLILALQLTVFWGWWSVADLTAGDTSFYFMGAWQWFHAGRVNLAWSPLYSVFYGSFLFVNPDPVWVTYAHRAMIVFASALLTLAALRRLLPPKVAW